MFKYIFSRAAKVSATPGIARQCAWYRSNNAAYSQSHVNNTFAYKNVICALRNHILWATEHWFCVLVQFPLLCKQKGEWTAGTCTGGTEHPSHEGFIALSNLLTWGWSRKRKGFSCQTMAWGSSLPSERSPSGCADTAEAECEARVGDIALGRGMSSMAAAAGPCLPPVLAASMSRSQVSFPWDGIISWFPLNWFSCWVNSVFHFVFPFLSVPWLSVQFSWNWLLSSSSGYRMSDRIFFWNESFLKLQCTFSIFKWDKSSSP